MINKGKRTQGNPHLISNNVSKRLKRVELTEKMFNENWLQDIIQKNPEILPVDNIETNFLPLIPLGREIPTNVGFIDNLYISPDGYITIVETKLWRNPEAKREVVGQILDYAKELTTWNYLTLNNQVKKVTKNNKEIVEIIEDFELQDENSKQNLIDNIERNLKRGRFLLLIVGDGIRESVEDMVNYLSNSAQLLFTLGLIELQVYEIDKDLLIVPNLISRTREITRAVIRIENKTDSVVKIETHFEEENDKLKKSRTTLTEDDFFELLKQNTTEKSVVIAKEILDKFLNNSYIVDWKQASYVVKLLDPKGSGGRITILLVTKKGEVNIGYSRLQLKKMGYNINLSLEFAQKVSKLYNIPISEKYPSELKKWMKLEQFGEKLNEFLELSNEFKENIINDIE